MTGERPVILLDVDGVLHDRAARDQIRMSDDPDALAARLGVTIVVSHGRKLAIPHYMAGLVQHLVATAEVWWCTTWRRRANDDLPGYLGIDPLPVIDDGTRAVGLEWKAEAARPLVEAARHQGRCVYWIEDFDGTYPDTPGVTYIDTAGTGILTPSDLPTPLRPNHPAH